MRSNLSSSLRAAGAAAAVLGLAVLCGGCRTAPSLTPGGFAFQTGIASWYGPGFHGRATSTREPYDMYDATAAHNTLPFGTQVLVTNLDNGKSAIVRINDRGPFSGGRIIDLSYSAAYLLDMIGPGTAQVRLDILKKPSSSARTSAVSVQVGAFTTMERAQAVVETLALEFPRVRVAKYSTPERDYYRVRIPAGTRREAVEIASRLAERGIPVVIFEGD